MVVRFEQGKLSFEQIPPVNGTYNRFSDILALTDNNVWAVGYTTSLATFLEQPLIMHWNGSTWMQLPALGSFAEGKRLNAIAGISENDLWAVGTGIVLHWDGVKWTEQPKPTYNSFDVELKSITLQGNTLWGAGRAIPYGSAYPIVAQFNGGAWQTTYLGDNGEFNDITVAPDGDIWAVGATGSYTLLVYRYHNGVWTALPVGEPGVGTLNGITARTANDIWVVGSGTFRALSYHWDGSQWSEIPAPGERLWDITAMPEGEAIVVGAPAFFIARYAPYAIVTTAHIQESQNIAEITVRLTASAAQQVTLDFAVNDKTATADVDYTPVSGQLTIAPCQTQQQFTIPIIDDQEWEGNETIKVTLSNPLGALLDATSSRDVIIRDIEDAPSNRVTFLPIITNHPSMNRIAYVDNSLGQKDIVTINPDGTDERRLTTNNAGDYAPAWSPDGKRIAFISERDGNPEIYVMSADGSNQTRLTNTPDQENSPAWSPDGSHIAYHVWGSSTSSIYIMNADGSSRRRVSPPPYDVRDGEPAWSPDGAHLAFSSNRASKVFSDIYVMNVNGAGLTRLTYNPGDHFAPTWSPDGTRILFAAGPVSRMDLFTIRPDGADLQLMSPNFDTGGQPSWSADGKTVSYNTGSLYPGGNIMLIELSGGAPRRLGTIRFGSDPAWSP